MATSMDKANEYLKKTLSEIYKWQLPTTLSSEAIGNLSYERKSHFDLVPLPEEHLRERAEFVENFLALQKEGLEKGFLDYDHCYECSGAVIGEVGTVQAMQVWDETEEEYQARLAELPPTVTFPVKGRDE